MEDKVTYYLAMKLGFEYIQKNGVIYFVLGKGTKFNTAYLNDSFSYRLEAPGVQPANGLFEFMVMAQRGQDTTKSISNPITEDVTGIFGHGSKEQAGSKIPGKSIIVTISATFIAILILIVLVFVIHFKRLRNASRTKCMAPNNTLFNDEPPARAHSIDCNSKGNPCDSIQRCGSRVRLPLSNGFTLLEHRSQNDLR